jgi:serine/threonine-protein kinase RsbW
MTNINPVFKVRETTDSIGFTFSSTMENIDEVCEKTMSYLESAIMGIQNQVFAINLVLREGLTNAVRHGNANNPEKLVMFDLTITDSDFIKIAIEDQGDGFDWQNHQTKELPDQEDHGRGIIIMKTYFNTYSYNKKGNILYLEKNLSS